MKINYPIFHLFSICFPFFTIGLDQKSFCGIFLSDDVSSKFAECLSGKCPDLWGQHGGGGGAVLRLERNSEKLLPCSTLDPSHSFLGNIIVNKAFMLS